MDTSERQALRRLLDREALHELVVGYCRAVDRLDAPAFVALFHADAVVDSGVLRGPPETFAREFVRWVETQARLVFHTVGNEHFVIDGDRARGECYVTAIARLRGAAGEQDVLTVGRYLDRCERRAGVWKIAERRFVLDHSVVLREGLAALPARAASEVRGAFGADDPAHAFWRDG